MKYRLPHDFGFDARRKAENCPYVLNDRAANCLTPGTVVFGTNSGIETAFPTGKTVRMVLFGFIKPFGYACCLDRDGEWWVVHPEALKPNHNEDHGA